MRFSRGLTEPTKVTSEEEIKLKDCQECGIVEIVKENGKKQQYFDRSIMLDVARTCKGYTHYAPSDIKYCPTQIAWLLENAEILYSGKWVKEASSYIDTPIGSQGNLRKAPVRSEIMEVERRLESCNLDGLMVTLFYRFGLDERFLSRYYKVKEGGIRFRIEAVVWYISGLNFRAADHYQRWLNYRGYERWLKRK